MSEYKWKFSTIGGATRVSITSGEDIAHLPELDNKLWTVLSCPVNGLEFDAQTLALLDTDNDGKIRVEEVKSAAKWLTGALKDSNSLLKGESVIKLDQFNEDDAAGLALRNSARQILSNLGLEKDEISIEEASDSARIFAKTAANGDGVISESSTADADLQAIIKTCAEKIGSTPDRSGEAGVTEEQLEAFYAACADYSAWQAAAKADPAVLPYGADTAAAFAAAEGLKDKIADYFMRCKLVKFDSAVNAAVDVSVEKVAAIGGENLAVKAAEIATYPLARPTDSAVLPYEGINPAWQAAFADLKALVLDVDYPGATEITEAQWQASLSKFGPYSAWLGAKKGDSVESLGLEAVDAVIKADRKADLLKLVEADKACKAESDAIDDVKKFMHLYRDFHKLLCNYVLLSDFYDRKPGVRAIFEAGQLYIDQRCCDLCVRVADMGKHADMASLSGMFLIYCKCTSKVKNETMDVVAVMTDGNTRELRPGKNGIFYDLSGQDWDATITKVVDNPISVKQAFWAPYVKFANTISERINKSAAEKEAKANASMVAKANDLNAPAPGAEAPKVAPQPFDIGKFAGIFAAVGLGLGMVGTALAAIVKPWYTVLLVLLALVVCISGPSMFIAWNKLRKRNLGPVLNANGWAINSIVLVNILFGKKLTSIARYPKVKMKDPYAKKGGFGKALLCVLVLLVIAFAVLYFTHNLGFLGIA